MKHLLRLLLLGLFFLAFFPLWLPPIGDFLLVPDEKVPAEAIVVLRGDDYFRFQKAADLLAEGYGDKILVAPIFEEIDPGYVQFQARILSEEPVEAAEYVRRALAFYGVGSDRIEVLPLPVTSTYEEAMGVRRYAEAKGLRSILLVTSTYHMRRALMIFKKVLQGSGVSVAHVMVESPGFKAREWWRQELSVKQVLQEYLSIGFNLVYHFLLGHERTGFDAP
ncbi:MAG: YdcF family protein [Candidatus Omnitrophota bacterium]